MRGYIIRYIQIIYRKYMYLCYIGGYMAVFIPKSALLPAQDILPQANGAWQTPGVSSPFLLHRAFVAQRLANKL